MARSGLCALPPHESAFDRTADILSGNLNRPLLTQLGHPGAMQRTPDQSPSACVFLCAEWRLLLINCTALFQFISITE